MRAIQQHSQRYRQGLASTVRTGEWYDLDQEVCTFSVSEFFYVQS